MKQKNTGFTIVELLIVVVVIAILATVAVVAYNGIQKSALNAHKLSSLTEWRDLFQLYNLNNSGRYPTPSTDSREHCLGKDFKYNACWNVYDVYGTSGVLGSGPRPNEPVQYVDTQLMTQLENTGKLPDASYCLVKWYCPDGDADGVGPLVSYRNGLPYKVWDFFLGGTCPGDLTPDWTDGNQSTCSFKITTPEQIEITNVILNPSVDAATPTGWLVGEWGTSGNGTSTRETSGGASGANFFRMRWTTASTARNAYINIPAGTAGQGAPYACSLAARTSVANASAHAVIIWIDSVGGWISQSYGTTAPLTATWNRYGVKAVAPSGTTTAACLIRMNAPTAMPVGATFDADAIIFANTNNQIPLYADGNATTQGWRWNGTLNNATSSGPFL